MWHPRELYDTDITYNVCIWRYFLRLREKRKLDKVLEWRKLEPVVDVRWDKMEREKFRPNILKTCIECLRILGDVEDILQL